MAPVLGTRESVACKILSHYGCIGTNDRAARPGASVATVQVDLGQHDYFEHCLKADEGGSSQQRHIVDVKRVAFSGRLSFDPLLPAPALYCPHPRGHPITIRRRISQPFSPNDEAS